MIVMKCFGAHVLTPLRAWQVYVASDNLLGVYVLDMLDSAVITSHLPTLSWIVRHGNILFVQVKQLHIKRN